MDISGCWSGIVIGWDSNSIADVQESSEMDKTEDKMATAGRVTMVPQTGGLFLALLDLCACLRALRQVSILGFRRP